MKENKHYVVSDMETLKWENDGKKYCAVIRTDEDPEDPRGFDGNLCTLACWHRHYRLGDDIGNASSEDFFRDLVRKNVSESEVLSAALDGRIPGIRAVKMGDDFYNVYETYYIRTPFGKSEPKEYLEHSWDDAVTTACNIMDDITVEGCMVLLEPYAAILPLWLYDHGGITMSCGTRMYPYNDRWDSSCVGFAIAMKSEIIANTCKYVLDENGERIRVEHKHDGKPSTWSYKVEKLTDETWRDRAEEIIRDEVEMYDMYLRGEVYGFVLYEADAGEDEEEPDWEEIDSCWGFYGDDIIESGLAEAVGCDLYEAILSDKCKSGMAAIRTTKTLTF